MAAAVAHPHRQRLRDEFAWLVSTLRLSNADLVRDHCDHPVQPNQVLAHLADYRRDPKRGRDL